MQISSPLVYAAEKWANSGIKWPWRKNDAEPSLRVIEGAHRIAPAPALSLFTRGNLEFCNNRRHLKLSNE